MPVAPGWNTNHAVTALLDALNEGVLMFDDRQLCRVAGRKVGELLGVDARSLVGQTRGNLVDLISAASSSTEMVNALRDDILSEGSTVADPVEIVRPHARTVVWTSFPIIDSSGVVGRIDILRDVTHERHAEHAFGEMARRLEESSTIDELTGLFNLRRFDEEALREHRRSQRAWTSYALVRVDIDGMAGINEARGEKLGDDLIRRVAEELKAGRREYDLVARGAEDEFLLLLPGVDGTTAKRVLKRAIERIHERGRELVAELSVSAGVAIWMPPSGETPADLLERAGTALQRARVRGAGAIDVDVAAGEWKGGDEAGE